MNQKVAIVEWRDDDRFGNEGEFVTRVVTVEFLDKCASDDFGDDIFEEDTTEGFILESGQLLYEWPRLKPKLLKKQTIGFMTESGSIGLSLLGPTSAMKKVKKIESKHLFGSTPAEPDWENNA